MTFTFDAQTIIIALIGGLISALVTGGFNSWNLGRTISNQAEQNRKLYEHQAHLERLKDERALRDAKGKRLRDLYRPMLTTAIAMEGIVMRQRYLLQGETREERDEQINVRWREVTEQSDRAQTEIALETEPKTRQIYETYRDLNRTFRSLQTHLAMNREHPHLVERKELEEERAKVQSLVATLEEAIREHLLDFDRPR